MECDRVIPLPPDTTRHPGLDPGSLRYRLILNLPLLSKKGWRMECDGVIVPLPHRVPRPPLRQRRGKHATVMGDPETSSG